MEFSLLVDSEEFWSSLQKDIRTAKENVYLQTLSFEADRVGLALLALLNESDSKDIRLLVDS